MQWKILVGCNIVRRSATGDLWGLGMKTMIRIWYPVVNLCFLFLFFPSFPFCVWVSNKMSNYRRVLTFPETIISHAAVQFWSFLLLAEGKSGQMTLKNCTAVLKRSQKACFCSVIPQPSYRALETRSQLKLTWLQIPIVHVLLWVLEEPHELFWIISPVTGHLIPYRPPVVMGQLQMTLGGGGTLVQWPS